MKGHVVNVWLYPKSNRFLLKGFKQWNDMTSSHVEREGTEGRYKVCEWGKIDSIPTKAIRGRTEPVDGREGSRTYELWGQTTWVQMPALIFILLPQIPEINFFWIAYLVVHLRVFLLLWLVYGGVHMHWYLFLSTLHDPYQPIHLR